MNKIGMHIHELSSQVYGALQYLQPTFVILMDPTPQWIRDVRAAMLNCYIGVRKYEHGLPFWERDPWQWADEVAAMCGDALRLVGGAITYNEPLPAGHDDHSIFPIFDQWQAKMIARLQDVYDVDALAFPFGTGQFTAAPDRVRLDVAFPRSCEVCRVLSPHDYDWDHLGKSVGWRAMRWLAWLDDIEAAGFGRKRVAVSECGLTQGTYGGPDVGWQTLDPNLLAAVARYMESLRWYNKQLVAVPECVGCATYDWGGTKFGWGTFEHVGISHLIEQIALIDDPAPPPEPPEPPNGGEPYMGIRVFNIEGQELFDEQAADLVKYHGITVHEPVGLRQGEYYWAVTVLQEGEGPACTIVTGLWEDGSLAAGQELAWAWTDNMGDADEIAGHNYPTDWQSQADLGWLNDQANIGLAFGQHGWFHKPYEPGPGRLWIRDKLRWSVHLTGIGMLDMTNHRTMYPTYQIKQWAGDGEPPPTPPDGDTLKLIQVDVAAIREILEQWEEVPPTPPPPADTPFHGEYFNNITLSGTPVLTRDDEKIGFDWGEGSPGPGVNADNFSVRWMGKRTFEARTYTFHVTTDDGFRLWVDGQLLIDAWKDQAPAPYQATKAMTAGQHDIKAEYYERGGLAVAKLWWE